MDRDQILTALNQTPPTMAASLASPAAPTQPLARSADAWGVGDVVRHMRAADAIISQRLWAMLLRDDAVLWGYDEREWGRLMTAADQPLVDQIEAFG